MLNIIDCTFRDGGYYNNWRFDISLIKKYLKALSKTNIKHIEIGFRFAKPSNPLIGSLGYTKESFLKNILVPKNIRLGVMINASEYLEIKNYNKFLNKNFLNSSKSKIKFIRIACHHEEIFKIHRIIKYFNKKKIKVFVNIMQVVNLSDKQINKICNFLNDHSIEALYLADSSGSCFPRYINQLVKKFKKKTNIAIGIHAHDNMGLALKNTIAAIETGATWVDSTVLGMGRGAGNLKTEVLLKKIKSNSKPLKKLINNYFLKLRNKYKWGKNKYYLLAAKYLIHPTYIQQILSNDYYKFFDKINIINNLKKMQTRFYDPLMLSNSLRFFLEKKKYKKLHYKFSNRNVLIVGPGIINEKVFILFVKKYNPFVIALNFPSLKNSILGYIDCYAISHPFSINSNLKKIKSCTKKIIFPYSSLSGHVRDNFHKKKNLIDYGLKINKKNRSMSYKNDYCIIAEPTALFYSVSFILSRNFKKIYVSGLDGFDDDNTKADNTEVLWKSLRKNKIKVYSLTKTKHNIPQIEI